MCCLLGSIVVDGIRVKIIELPREQEYMKMLFLHKMSLRQSSVVVKDTAFKMGYDELNGKWYAKYKVQNTSDLIDFLLFLSTYRAHTS